jgi:hypothetical protein
MRALAILENSTRPVLSRNKQELHGMPGAHEPKVVEAECLTSCAARTPSDRQSSVPCAKIKPTE